MKTVFVDTYFWVAGLNPREELREEARQAELALGNVRFITTESVLIELLNFYAEYQPYMRLATVNLVKRISIDPKVEVVEHTHDTFLFGLEFYESRPDKGYSLTDCISMNLMRERGINEVLTHDHHFEQEGFTILL
jgi:predicted nucleic acid-binding protein